MASHTPSDRPARTPLAAAAFAVTLSAAALLVTACSPVERVATKSVAADATVAEAVTAVEVLDARSGDVEVTTGGGPGVSIRRTVHYRGDAVPRPGQSVSGGVLTFTEGCAGTCRVDYRLEVPASAKVKVTNSSGRITVTGVGAAELESSSGDVRAERVTGPLKIRTSSGDITGTALDAAETAVRSGSGDATLDFTRAPAAVSVTASSGDVTLKVPSAPYRLETSTNSGSRDLTLPATPTAPSGLTVRTTSGDIRVSAV
ncbi:DUF4097 family beta strand repeat-containing protein [Streptomyces sp. RerS4]|uniref:DUF4097 family beta strand repeat-containing protein n=1 Tax=Streptomyces sp. RerS4 TaxID=2942449 RepID=UPI00201CAB80|nr:DUF4097 family beta strand repeat-containing protein [Streptomyces sp. RerS4]UQX02966.1 DUF4097 domain-containing protein [Streptomyces sp. RerS4]